ncbi:hypothetical protein ACFX15_002073 [Malus domestica]
MKIQLMHDIAWEFSIEWDSKALEQKLYTSPTPDQGQHRYRSPVDSDNNMHKSHKGQDKSKFIGGGIGQHPLTPTWCRRARSHGRNEPRSRDKHIRFRSGKAKTNFPTPTELHLDGVNIANMNNASKLAVTTNISNSHSSTMESSSPPSPRPLDLTLKTPLFSTGGGYFTAAKSFRLLPAFRPVIFFDPFALADGAAALQHVCETCRFDPPPAPTSGSSHSNLSSSSVVDFERTFRNGRLDLDLNLPSPLEVA